MKRNAETVATVHPRAEPYFFSKGDIGCLLIHGFTGSPPELLPLGEYLVDQGCTVLAPLLAGHGTSAEDLARTRWTDWLKSAMIGLDRLRAEPVKQVYLIGLSMGGLLALLLAVNQSISRGERYRPDEFEPVRPLKSVPATAPKKAIKSRNKLADESFPVPFWLDRVLPKELQTFPEHSDKDKREVPIAGVIMLNTPIFIRNSKVRFSPWLQWFFPYTSKEFEVISAKEADALRFSYTDIPIRGVANLLRLIQYVKERLRRIEVPALVIQSRVDETVRPESGEFIYRNLGSEQKKILWLEKSPHLLTLSSEKDRIFQTIVEWIKRSRE
ncbi:MAG: alpha/beta fold hydrolase [Syntrophomonadaceae bacterium]|nr:alpha/beta fold hydrolase [Syntrophomonadaceae bacterium]